LSLALFFLLDQRSNGILAVREQLNTPDHGSTRRIPKKETRLSPNYRSRRDGFLLSPFNLRDVTFPRLLPSAHANDFPRNNPSVPSLFSRLRSLLLRVAVVCIASLRTRTGAYVGTFGRCHANPVGGGTRRLDRPITNTRRPTRSRSSAQSNSNGDVNPQDFSQEEKQENEQQHP
jgi:hypothetical protein